MSGAQQKLEQLHVAPQHARGPVGREREHRVMEVAEMRKRLVTR